jgi:hypothetical protein
VRRALRQALTGRDNFTVDLYRVLAVVAVAIGIGLEVFVVIWREGKGFDLQAYGVGIGGLLLAGAGALKLKETTEPGESTTIETKTTLTETKGAS